MIKKYLLLSALVCFLPARTSIPSTVTSNIKEINSIQEVKDVFQQACADDLFIFDVDEVLLEMDEPINYARFHKNQVIKEILTSFLKFVQAKQNPEGYVNTIVSKFMLNARMQPIEQELCDNVVGLVKRGIKVIALTAIRTGELGNIKRLEHCRYNQLLSLGIDFSKSFNIQEIELPNLEPHPINRTTIEDPNVDFYFSSPFNVENVDFTSPTHCSIVNAERVFNHVLFYKGILCSETVSKGDALRAFLEKTGFNPAHIFFFDDKHKNVTSVVQTISEMGIPCQGFVYKAETKRWLPDYADLEVVRFQFELIKQQDGYVSYSEAKEILQHHRNNIKIPQAEGPKEHCL